MVVVALWELLPSIVQRLVSVGLVAVGAWLLSMVSYPPHLQAEFPSLLLGGILGLLGLVGIVDPDRLVPKDIGDQAD